MERGRLLLQMGPEDGEVRVAPERRLAGQALVEHAAQRVEVGAEVDRLASDLLGGGVVDRAQELAGARQPRARAHLLGEPEVAQVRVLTLGQQHVARLDVPVYEAAPVGGVERPRHLPENVERTGRPQRVLALQQRPKVRALHVAHGDVEHAVGLAGVVDRDHVGMVETGGDLQLAQEAVAEAGVIGQLGRKELERCPAVQAQVLGQIDDPHSSLAQHRFQPVAGQLAPDHRIGVRRHAVSLGSRADGRKTAIARRISC